jgi:hypothetical protein
MSAPTNIAIAVMIATAFNVSTIVDDQIANEDTASHDAALGSQGTF